jgi:hypothetical protein
VNFFRNLLIFTGVVSIGIGLLSHYTGIALVHPLIWYILLFFVVVTALAYYVSRLGVSYDPDNFQLYYFGSMGFRMILSIAVIFIYVFMYSENELQFVFNFFVLYFLFTGFEIYSLLANFAPHLKKHNEV